MVPENTMARHATVQSILASVMVGCKIFEVSMYACMYMCIYIYIIYLFMIDIVLLYDAPQCMLTPI